MKNDMLGNESDLERVMQLARAVFGPSDRAAFWQLAKSGMTAAQYNLVRKITEENPIAISEENPIAIFVFECCRQDAGAICLASELFKCFKKWYANSFPGRRFPSQKRFGTEIGRLGFQKEKYGTIRYFGIDIKENIENSNG